MNHTRGEQEHRFNIFKTNLEENKAHNNAGFSYKKGKESSLPIFLHLVQT